MARRLPRSRPLAIVIATAAVTLSACADVESPSEIDDGPTREDTLDATEFDVAPSP